MHIMHVNSQPPQLKAYFKLARKFHPDTMQGKTEREQQEAKEQFMQIQQAYELVGDEQKRKVFDQFGHAGR